MDAVRHVDDGEVKEAVENGSGRSRGRLMSCRDMTPDVAAQALEIALKALVDIKSTLRHQRRFGADTMGAWRVVGCGVEGDAEEALAAIRSLQLGVRTAEESCAASA